MNLKFWSTTIILMLLMRQNICLFAQDIKTLNENNISVSWEQAIYWYGHLDSIHNNAKLIQVGGTDVGKPLHLFIISEGGLFEPDQIKKQKKLVVFINNGIHPGEPDGIDASIRLSTQLLSPKAKSPKDIVICIIPVFNVDGSLNGGCCTRANQNGPINQGFRGNARNLDLNRDFIKCDSENARSLARIFRSWDPDVFIDTHVSNGADYQHVMTLISTQHDKLGGEAGRYLKSTFTPALFKAMKKRGFPMAPYVSTKKYDTPPENGIYGFMETPRYSTGYAALYSSFAFVTETHMLKPFPKRVEATLALLEEFIRFSEENKDSILEIRKATRSYFMKADSMSLEWKVDTNQVEMVEFDGYEPVYRKSEVTGLEQLYYNRNEPFSRKIPFFDRYIGNNKVIIPEFYILPQAWREIVERMNLNQVKMYRLANDTVLDLSAYQIGSYKTSSNPYEGHYIHSETEITEQIQKIRLFAGDYFIPVDQPSCRYIVETLEPKGPDSFFSWGFFDSILQQKEWFSAYVFDGMASEILAKNQELNERFQRKKSEDSKFASSSFDQLYFIYKNSEWFENLNRYPVYKLGKGIHSDLIDKQLIK